MRRISKQVWVALFLPLFLAFTSPFAAAQEWIQLAPSGAAPVGRFAHSAVYDPGSNRLVIFAGRNNLAVDDVNSYLNDVWVLKNANGLGGTPEWEQLQPVGETPGGRDNPNVVYDAFSNRMIVSGGFRSPTPKDYGDAWVLTHANGLGGTPEWIQLVPIGPPPRARRASAVVDDSESNRMIVFGGACDGCADLNDTWVLENANGLGGTAAWMELAPLGTIPSPRRQMKGVYDANENRMMVFGAMSIPTLENETWILENANGLGGTPTWTQLVTSDEPTGPRASPVLGYDSATNRMISFDGVDYVFTGSGYTDTWVLTNANGIGATPTWMELIPTSSPPPRRILPEGAYDPGSNRLMVFGGCVTPPDAGCSGVFLNDTWVLTHANGLLIVQIDIKPGSDPNSINLGSGGTVPVAILSTPDFDARDVDPLSTTLAGAQVRLKGKGTPMASFEDVNGDGLLDLVVRVSTEALQLSEGDTEAILRGQTFAGKEIRGTDSVRIVP